MISLFLDLDGTLIELAARPDAVTVPGRLPALLAGLEQKLHGALAIATGRNLATLDSLLTPFRGPAIGVHGAEYRESGEGEIRMHIPLPPGLRAAINDIAKPYPGVMLEDKGIAIALHFNGDTALAVQLQASLADICQREASQWHCLTGHRVIEIKPAATSKGAGLARMMAVPAFAGTMPVAIGDDITDLDLFSAAKKHDGLTLSVGNRIVNAGDRHLPSPASVMVFLERWLAEPSVVHTDAVAAMAEAAGGVRTVT